MAIPSVDRRGRQADLADSTWREGWPNDDNDEEASDGRRSGGRMGERVLRVLGRTGALALLLDGERLTVGSAPDNDVVVDERSVSRVHAVLHRMNGHWFIEDCGSRNGTSVNAHPSRRCGRSATADEVRLGRARSCSGVRHRPAGRRPTRSIERPPVTAREHDVLVALCRPLANGDVFTEPATVKEIAADSS